MQTPFPAKLPLEKPDRELSASMERMYDIWNPHEDRGNEFFSNFKYSPLEGFSREPNVSRRDPSKVLRIDGTYYVWYTCRRTKGPPVGHETPPTTSPLSIGTSQTSGMPPAKTAFTGKNRDQPPPAHQKANLAGAQTAPPTSSSGKTNTTSITRHTAKSFRAATRAPSPSPLPTLPMDPGRDWADRS